MAHQVPPRRKPARELARLFPLLVLLGILPIVARAQGDLWLLVQRDLEGERCTCIENLRAIEKAAYLHTADDYFHPYEGESSGSDLTYVDLQDLVRPGYYLDSIPICPAHGVYTIPRLRQRPTCSLGTADPNPHALAGSDTPPLCVPFSSLEEERATCQANLRAIAKAKTDWYSFSMAIEDYQPAALWIDLVGVSSMLQEKPDCPNGGEYTIGLPTELPSCSLHDVDPYLHIYREAEDPLARINHPYSDQMGLVATVMPSYQKRCHRNLDLVARAVSRWAIDHGQYPGGLPTWDDLVGPTGYLRHMPICPQGGSYTIGKAGEEKPACSLGKNWTFHHQYRGTINIEVRMQEDSTGRIVGSVRTGCQEALLQIHYAKEAYRAAHNPASDFAPTIWQLHEYMSVHDDPWDQACRFDSDNISVNTMNQLPSCVLATHPTRQHTFPTDHLSLYGRPLFEDQ